MAKRRSRHEQTFPEVSDRNLRLQFKETQELVAQLRTDLENERAHSRNLARERSFETKKIREEEQTKMNITIKDLRAKMLSEKQREIENQRESLREKYDTETQKQLKQKESELQKLRLDLKKLQEELQDRGLSGTARSNSFDVERGRLVHEISELRGIKKNLEESLERVTANDRQKVYEMQRMEDAHKAEIAQINHNAESEIRKLIDELKSRGRIIGQMEKELGVKSGHYERAQMEKESMRDLLIQTREAESWEKRSPKSNTSMNSSFGELPSTESISKDEEKRLKNKISELSTQIKKTEEKCCSLAQDKADLLRKIKEMEKKQKPSQEKNKRFLEKNMELTSINRNLEEKIKTLSEENTKLKLKIEHNKSENIKLSRQLSEEKVGRRSYESVVEELEDLQRQTEEQSKTTEALKQACLEKDRRIELIQHRRRRQRINKQQQKAAGMKETFYGYDEDSRSIDSEVSVSSMSYASGDDDFWDEFTREEYEKNYQRLVREHLELEKSCALLQGQNGSSHVDPQRETKLRAELEADLLNAQSRIEDLEKLTRDKGQDLSWMDEKQALNTSNRMYREKIKELEVVEQKLEHELQELQEQNEVLEFRILELEESNEKLAEEVRLTVTFQYPPVLTDDGMLQMMAEEIGLVEIHVDELKERIYDLRHNKDSELSRDDKIVLLQARAMLDIADKKLKEMTASEGALRERVRHLEAEKADLLSATTGLSSDLILEHEDTRNKLMDAELKIKHLEDDIEEFKQSEAVFKYTQDVGLKTEDRYRCEISELKKQLSSSYEGRDYESELFQEKMDQLRIAEQRVAELAVTNKTLEDRLDDLERQNGDLQDQLTMQQDDQSLTESDKDMSSLLHNLRVRLSQHEKSEGALMERNQSLQHEVTNLKAKMAEYESIETQFTERNMTLRESLAASKKQNKTMSEEIVQLREQLRQSQSEVTMSEYESMETQLSERNMTLRESLAASKKQNKTVSDELERLKEQLRQSETEVQQGQQESRLTSDLENEYKDLQSEMFMLKEELSNRDADLHSLRAQMDREIAALKEENAALKKKLNGKVVELDEKEEDLNRSLDCSFDLENKIITLEQEVEEFKSKVNSGEYGDITPLKQKIDNISASESSLKERMGDLEVSEASLKKDLEALSKRESDLKRQLSELQNSEHDLKERLAEKEAAEVTLEEKVRQLEESTEDNVAIIADLEQERDDLTDLVNELEVSKEALEVKVTELQDQHQLLSANTQKSLEEASQSKQHLADQVQQLELNNRELMDTIEELRHDLSSKGSGESAAPAQPHSDASLAERVTQLQRDNLTWEDKYEMMQEEKMRQIEALRHQVESMEDHELRLTETIVELEDNEVKLRQQIKEYQQAESGVSKVTALEDKVVKLESVKQNLTDRLEQMELNEQLLRQQLREYDGAAEPEHAYLGQITQLQDKVNHLEARESKLMEKIYQAQLTEQELIEQLEEFESNAKTMSTAEFDPDEFEDYGKSAQELKEKIDTLRESNCELEARAETLKDEKDALSSKVRELADQLESTESELMSQKDVVEKVKMEAEEEMKRWVDEKKKSEERLSEKVQLLEESEEKLMERLMQLEESRAEEVKGQDMSDGGSVELRQRIQQLEVSEQKLTEQLQNAMANDSDTSRLQKKVELLMDTEERLMETIAQKDDIVNELRQSLAKAEMEQDYSDRQIERLEADEKSLKQKVKLEKQLASQAECVNIEIVPTVSSRLNTGNTMLPSSGHMDNDSTVSLPMMETKRSTFEELERQNKMELISQIQELEGMQVMYRSKVAELKHNLSTLRQVMETVSYSMSTDADIPVITTRSQAKSANTALQESEYERKVQELVRSEVALKLNIFQLEQKADQQRSSFQEKDQRLQGMAEDLKTQIEDLEDELDKARKSEARLKNKLEYGSHGQENQALAKIQHLEGLVFDLESSEKKLKRKIQELEQRERDLQERIEDAEKDGGVKRPVQFTSLREQKQHYDLYKVLEQVKLLESADTSLKEQIAVLQRQPEAGQLLQRLEQAERREKALRVQLELLESEDARTDGRTAAACLTDTMLDTPEAILKQRIRELEKMEKHLKQQVAELERDREELHEIARKDKSVIHELNVTVRELQLQVQHLKEQLARYEVTETGLQDRVDALQERIQDHEDVIREMTAAEKDLRDKMYKYKYGESTVTAKVTGLEQTIDDMKNAEAKLKTRIKDLEQEKKALADKVDELLDKMGDIQASETSLKQKLRNIEQNDVANQSRIAELDMSEKQSTKRKTELENRNEALSQKLRILEEEKASLMFDNSELKTDKEEFLIEKDRLNSSVKNLKSELDELRNQYNKSKEQVHETQLKEIELQGRLRELEHMDHHQRDKINRLESNEDNLKERIHLLDANVSTAENKASSAGSLEQENSQLYTQLEHTHTRIDALEQQARALNTIVQQYERSHANNDMAVLPRQQLTEIRAQVALLEDTERTVAKLEKEQVQLKDTVSKLRRGMNACGHELELEELKAKVDRYNAVLKERDGLQRALVASRKANELQKENFNDAKLEMKKSQNGVFIGRSKTHSRHTQVDQRVALHTTPEFKQALQSLKSSHPEAYAQISKSLPKSDSKKASPPDHVMPKQAAIAMTTPKNQWVLAMEEAIVPQESRSVDAEYHQGASLSTTVHVADQQQAIRDLISVLPAEDVHIRDCKIITMATEESDSDSSLDEEPIAGTLLKAQSMRPIDTANEAEKAEIINNLLNVLPSGDLHPVEEGSHLEQAAETEHGTATQSSKHKENHLWAGIEQKSLGQDDISLGVAMKDDVAWSDIEADDPNVQDSAAPPPLPSSQPPAPPRPLKSADSFYLPDQTSADEASDIDEDTAYSRAASVDRSYRRSHSKSPSRGKLTLGRLSESMESVADSGMGTLCVSDMSSGLVTPHVSDRQKKHSAQKLDTKSLLEKIELLEKQLKEKEKEASNTDINETMPKSKQKEQERKLELEQIVNRDLTNKVKNLEEDLVIKNKKLTQMEIELRNTARELRGKELANLSPIRPVHEDTVAVTMSTPHQFSAPSPSEDYSKKDVSTLPSLLERKDKELRAKSNEVDRLTKELRKWQEEMTAARDQKQSSEQQLKTVQNKLDKLKEMESNYEHISQSYQTLQKEHTELQAEHSHLEQAESERQQLERRTSELRHQLGDLERLALEKRDLSNKLTATHKQLKDKTKSESEVTKDNIKLQHEIDCLLGDKGMSDQMIRDYRLVRSKYEEMERNQMRAHMAIAPLRAKVMRLAHKCQQKDELIKRLSEELRRLSAGEPSNLITEADREQSKSCTEEYHRPLSPLMTNASTEAYQEEMTESRAMVLNAHLSKIPRRLRNKSESSSVASSEHSLDLAQSLSRDILNGIDSHYDSILTSGIPRSSSVGDLLSPRHVNGSTEHPPQLSTPPVTQLNNLRLLEQQQRPHRQRSRSREGASKTRNAKDADGQRSPTITTDTFRAVKDYDPEQFSYSGHPRLELTLKEGDQVKVLGPVDDKGYYEAQVHGQMGLVPATYLSPVYSTKPSMPTATRRQKQHIPDHLDSSPEQILGMHQHLQTAHVSNHEVPQNSTSLLNHRPLSSLQQNGSIMHPAFMRVPPVTMATPPTTSAIVHPALQSRSSSNGRLATAGQSPSMTPRNVQSAPSPAGSSASASAAGVLRSAPSHYSSVHSLMSNQETPVKEGPPDSPSHFKIQRVLGRHSLVLSWGPPSMDAMARNNGSVVSGYKIYIDGREKQWVRSPHLTKALIERLDLRRPHHFAIHTVTESQQASKPAEVVYESMSAETVSEFGGSDRESAGDGDVSSALSSSCYSDGERRVFMAVYDYSPAEHSPNSFPSHELAFRCGDMVTTYGSLRPDGFYHGKVHGKKGLVPASFIEEVAISKTRSIKSLSTSTLNSHQASSLASTQVSGERPRKLPHSHHRHTHLTAQV